MITPQDAKVLNAKIAALKAMLRDDPRLPGKVCATVRYILEGNQDDEICRYALKALDFLPDDFGEE